VKLTLADWLGLTAYGFILLACARSLARILRSPRPAREPAVVVPCLAGIVGAVSAMAFFLVADGTSATILRLQGWLLWPCGILFAGSSLVSIWAWARLRKLVKG
jgi:hypothetical protein